MHCGARMKNPYVPKYDYELPFRVAGIPCLIGVDGTNYKTCEVAVLDRRGYEAPWLERKMKAYDRSRMWEEVREALTPAFCD
jgi:hypothetical protein